MRDIIKLLESLNVEVDEAYGGEDAAESYLAYIDELVAKLDDKKIAYEIMNATDDIRKALDMEPTNARMNIESIVKEGLGELAHEAEKDHEVQMARSDLYKSAKYAVAIHKMLKDVSEMEGIDGWVAAKITKAADYLGAVKHYMEGEMMADVELAVVPVAGDMTDAMTVPQESVEVIEAEERDYICVHAKKGKYECSGTSSYAAAKKAAEHWGLKSTAGIDVHLADVKKTATESIKEERLGYSDLSSEDQSRVDLKCRQNPDWDSMDAGEKDKYRYKVAKEIGLVESKIEEGRNDGPMSECCDAPLIGFENGLGRCSECGEMAGAWNEDELDENQAVAEEDVIGDIIGKLAQTKAGSKSGKDVIGDIIAKLPKDGEETVKMPIPKSKPAAPQMSAQQQQAAANKAVRSMGQDKTTGDPRGILRQSKFSEWSKK